MAPDLSTTNLLLGIIAAVSVLEALAVVGVVAAGFVIYQRVLHVVDDLEQHHVAPTAARVNAILDDVKSVTSTVKQEAGRIDRLIERIFETVGTRRRPHAEPTTRVM